MMGFAFDQSGQVLSIDQKYNLTKSAGDDLYPSWSPDGSKIVFQSNRDGDWDILVYDLKADSVYNLTNYSYNEQHPVWIKNGSAIAFDADENGELKIYSLAENKGSKALLFDRELQAREASFSISETLVYFSGFDEIKNRWEIYSYEFYYNSLNKLTSIIGENHSPKVSPDEDFILFVNNTMDFPKDKLYLINWHGQPEDKFKEFNMRDPSWAPGGLKIFFVSNRDNRYGEVYSIWIDGSHLERLTEDSLEVRNPVLSPDAKYMAISVKLEIGYDIFLIPMEDY